MLCQCHHMKMTLTAQSASFYLLRTFCTFRLLHICKYLIQHKGLCKCDQRTSAKYPQCDHQREDTFHKACEKYGDNHDTCHETTIREVSQTTDNGIFQDIPHTIFKHSLNREYIKIPRSRNLRVSCCGVLKRYVQLHLRNPSLPGDYELISYGCNYSNFLKFFNTFLRYDLFFVEFNSVSWVKNI